MDKTHYIAYLLLMVFAVSCKTYIPHVPLDKYKTYYWNEHYTDHDVKLAGEGYYQLNVIAIDTVFARKRINYYTTNVQGQQNYQTVDSLFLYFIDDVRFVYSKKRLDSIDIVRDLGKDVKLGIYSIYRQSYLDSVKVKKDSNTTIKLGTYGIHRQPHLDSVEIEKDSGTKIKLDAYDVYQYKKEQDSVFSYYVDLIFMDSKVKDPQKYQYAVVTLRLSDGNNTLDYVIADYPIDYVSRDPVHHTNTAPFSPDVLQKERERFLESSTRTFESSDMDFKAQWSFKKYPIKTAINDIAYDNTVYSLFTRDSDEAKRDYYYKGKVVFTEYIRENSTQHDVISW